MDTAQSFWRDGFLVARGVFSPYEIGDFRQEAVNGGKWRGDLLSHPKLRRIVLDERLLGVVRALIGPNLVYFGDSSVSVGPTAAGFHKDNPDKNDPDAPDWTGRYPLVRFGIYTQDHKGKPDGLDLRLGSHEHFSTKIGKHVYADTQPGDVVIWNLRTSHSGSGMTVLGRPIDPESIPGKVLRRLPALRDKPRNLRVAFFGTFGAQSDHLDRYIAYLRTRQYAVDGWMASMYDRTAIEAAHDHGISLRDMRVELEAHPPAMVAAHHVDLPY